MPTGLLHVLALFVFLPLAACHVGHGERCNPSRFADDLAQGDCDDGFACVYPTAPACGVAYCCCVDAKGTVVDPHPSCQPDPSLADVCELPDLRDAD